MIPEQQHGATSTNASGGNGPGDVALSMLADLESRLGGLRKVHEQISATERALAAREADLVAREQGAQASVEQSREREAELERQRTELEERNQRFLQMEVEATARRTEIDAQERKLRDAREEIDRQRRSVEDERQRAEAEVKALAAQERKAEEERAARVAEKEREVADRERALGEREKSVAEWEQKFESVEGELDQRDMKTAEREKAITGKEQWFAEREKVMAEREQKVGEETVRHQRASSEFEEKLSAVLERERACEKRGLELQTKERAAEEAERMVAELAEREKELAELKDRLTSKEEELTEHQAQLERDRAGVAEQQRTLAARAADAESEGAAIFAGRTEQLQLELGEVKAERAALQTELAQCRTRIEELTAEVRSVVAGTTSAADELQRRDGRIADLESDLRKLQGASDEAAKKLEQTRAEALANKKAHEQATAESERAYKNELTKREGQIAEHEAARRKASEELDAMQRTIAELRERAERAESRSASGEAAGGVAPAELEKRDQAISLLKDRLERIQAENDSLAAKLRTADDRVAEAELAAEAAEHAAASETPEGGDAESGIPEVVANGIRRRQERLRTYKSLLQAQARKIVAAQSALHKRHTDCEQILSQRSRLSQLAAELSRREKRAASAKARSTAASVLLYVVSSLAIVAVMSWEVSKRVWPGTYIARAIVEADTRGRPAAPELVAAWQKDHEALIKDPRLMEFAADRFSRRGLPGLGTVTELQDRLSKDLYVQSPQPGQLVLELKGQGAEKTQLELDTFVTSLKSLADMSREERGNNLGLAVARPAEATQEPLMEQRLQYAGIVFGAGALGSLLLGAGLWWKLAGAKKTFDHSLAVEAALEGVDWAALEKTFRKPMKEERGVSSQKAA